MFPNTVNFVGKRVIGEETRNFNAEFTANMGHVKDFTPMKKEDQCQVNNTSSTVVPMRKTTADYTQANKKDENFPPKTTKVPSFKRTISYMTRRKRLEIRSETYTQDDEITDSGCLCGFINALFHREKKNTE
ncbi:11243_t:CDS:2 [Ambispora leptoticha]|uniref:11243_t:CDS:1 n=1 Tax=Ambispora leptoticha TaxID=144679 RepID=A0A9N8Z704_9GLOM|nr:11243_t:CDS:2 [Ambispora leptoticha]